MKNNKEIYIKISGISDGSKMIPKIDKNKLFSIIASVVKPRESTTIRGRQQLRGINKAIGSACTQYTWTIKPGVKTYTHISIRNNNGWLDVSDCRHAAPTSREHRIVEV